MHVSAVMNSGRTLPIVGATNMPMGPVLPLSHSEHILHSSCFLSPSSFSVRAASTRTIHIRSEHAI
jgi:hypothetical protein